MRDFQRMFKMKLARRPTYSLRAHEITYMLESAAHHLVFVRLPFARHVGDRLLQVAFLVRQLRQYGARRLQLVLQVRRLVRLLLKRRNTSTDKMKEFASATTQCEHGELFRKFSWERQIAKC